jgi:predicted phage tail component-like protein
VLSFTFGDKNSYIDFGILIVQRPSIPSPQRRISFLTIPGRSSSIKYDPDVYDDITITVECSVKDSNNLADKLDNIKGWLLSIGESDLIFSFQNDRKYIAQVVNTIDFKQIYKVLGKFPIVFNSKPFKYDISNNVIAMSICSIVRNQGTRYSNPVIKVYGSGNINLTVDTQIIQLTNISNHIIIDSELEDCYDTSGNNLNNLMSGDFPVLNVGDNNITWTGAVTKVEITPNWRWI